MKTLHIPLYDLRFLTVATNDNARSAYRGGPTEDFCDLFRTVRYAGALNFKPRSERIYLSDTGMTASDEPVLPVFPLCISLMSTWKDGAIRIVPTERTYHRLRDPGDIYDANSHYILAVEGPNDRPHILMGCRIVSDLLGLPCMCRNEDLADLPPGSIEIDQFYISQQHHSSACPMFDCARYLGAVVQQHLDQLAEIDEMAAKYGYRYTSQAGEQVAYTLLHNLWLATNGQCVRPISIVCPQGRLITEHHDIPGCMSACSQV
ncbi:hypothetical protein KC906_02395 [Candidatus Kaiserbacteria bacterium]|nr:hypothetical protein [Candidatus Kaiserbacteria bacterium]MCB9812207.1 hypothetical protein [Candidatus Nomurabacteria bacterium]